MWKWLLKKVMNYIVGNDVFGKVQALVAEVALDDTLSGSQKKDKVVTEAKALGQDMKVSAINLAIEAAVTLLKDK